MAKAKAKKNAGPGKLEMAIERLTGTVGMLRNEVERLTNMMGRVVFPKEAMDELIGELRAFRYLLDNRGDYSLLDRARAQKDIDRAKTESKPATAPVSSENSGKATV